MNTICLKPVKNVASCLGSEIDMSLVASIILGGGEGSRLYPLTKNRCKPAINFGGKYKLIDVPISHSIHSNCGNIFILTQFLSRSLHSHIIHTYLQQTKKGPSIEILTAEQKPNAKNWYQGTADAVRQNLEYLLESPAEYFLILSGDQLYSIDFKEMVRFLKQKEVDLVIASIPVNETQIPRMGAIRIDGNQTIIDFYEKPNDPAILAKFVHERVDDENFFLASMGIYLFTRKALMDLLLEDPREDFGKHLIPSQLAKGKVGCYIHQGFWEDIGTIKTFFDVNLALTKSDSPFCFYNEHFPIFNNAHHLPPVKISSTQIKNALLCEGALIEAKKISNSVIGQRSVIKEKCVITDSILMGNDYYESEAKEYFHQPARPQIGKGSHLNRCIIDKNVWIGEGVSLVNKKKVKHFTSDHLCIRDGIIVVPKGTVIPDGFVI